MKISKVLREAARRVEVGEESFSCAAVWHVEGEVCEEIARQPSRGQAEIYYANLMGQERWFGSFWMYSSQFDYEDAGRHPVRALEARAHRVVALCMAAAVAESEGL